MRRIVFFLMTTVTVVVLLFGYHTSTSSKAAGTEFSAVAPVVGGGSTTAGGRATTAAPTTAAPTTAAPTTAGATTAASSTVLGDSADTRWGPVQVQLTLQNGKITDVSVVQYPSGNGRDQEINANALPILVQETLSAQSAKIDMVSGATVTSDGYLTSLQSALDKGGL